MLAFLFYGTSANTKGAKYGLVALGVGVGSGSGVGVGVVVTLPVPSGAPDPAAAVTTVDDVDFLILILVIQRWWGWSVVSVGRIIVKISGISAIWNVY